VGILEIGMFIEHGHVVDDEAVHSHDHGYHKNGDADLPNAWGVPFRRGQVVVEGNHGDIEAVEHNAEDGIGRGEAAEADVDALYSLLKQKYGDKCGTFNTGSFLRFYWFGENPKTSGEWLGSVVLTKGDANDGVPRLYLWLKYGPIYYIDKASDF